MFRVVPVASRNAHRVYAARQLHTAVAVWSGHSKWSTIKHDKMKNDSQRNKVTNKIMDQISLAAKTGDQTKLDNMIELALKNNISKKVINNVLSKIGQKNEGVSGVTTVYEGVGPGGVSLLVRAQTDNKNRTASQIKSIFKKGYCSLSPTLYLFDKVGSIQVQKDPATEEDEIWDKIIDVEGINDLKMAPDGNSFQVTCEPTMTNKIAQELSALDFPVGDTEITYVPIESSKIALKDEKLLDEFRKFLDVLQANEDVTAVFHNLSTL